jgi:hypothetical protein
MKPYVFLDVDGVIADFAGASAALHGRGPSLDWWPLGAYDMAAAMGLSEPEFWAPINDAGADFWAGLAPLPWAEDLVQCIMRQCSGFTLLTSPSRHPSSAHGKVQWIHRMFGTGFRNYMIGSQKHLLSRWPGAILIDDFHANVAAFREHGGRAILFPQRWNANHSADQLSYTAAEIAAGGR